MIKKVLIFLSLVLSLPLFAQGRLYTKKVLLSDFQTKTTKIVVDENSLLGQTIKNEISTRWRISPYEFCSIEEGAKFALNNDYYLLHLINASGITFLSLDKGGKQDEENNLKKPFNLVQAPLCCSDELDSGEYPYIGALIDIIQAYLEKALENERVAYKGLEVFHGKAIKGLTLYLNSSDYVESFNNNSPSTAVGLCINGSGVSYKMIITCDTHELLYFRKNNSSQPLSWSENELSSFKKRNGIVTQ